MEKAEAASHLLEKVEQTAKIRFIASRRLLSHQRFSSWVVALASFALMLLPLLETTGATQADQKGRLVTLQVLLAGFVLIYSLLLSLENFSVRAEKMQSAGVELSILARQIEQAVSAGTWNQIAERVAERYGDILRTSDNHTYTDYLLHKVQKKEKYFVGKTSSFYRTYCSIAARSFFSYLHYLIFLAVLCGVLFYIAGLYSTSS